MENLLSLFQISRSGVIIQMALVQDNGPYLRILLFAFQLNFFSLKDKNTQSTVQI